MSCCYANRVCRLLRTATTRVMARSPATLGRYLSTEASRFAAVDHSKAYEAAMDDRHGYQLSLAIREGRGKDDPPFDPFLEEELAEERMEYGDEGVEEAEYEETGDGEDDEEFDSIVLYNNDGSIKRTKSQVAVLRAGAPAGGLFAVIELAGSQHKVSKDDVLVINRLRPVDKYKVGSVHTLEDVLLVGSTHLTLVGMPTVTGAEVDFMVEEITRDQKIIIFKKRRRKHSQRKNGFRRDVSILRVLDIRLPEAYKHHHHVGPEVIDGYIDAKDDSDESEVAAV